MRLSKIASLFQRYKACTVNYNAAIEAAGDKPWYLDPERFFAFLLGHRTHEAITSPSNSPGDPRMMVASQSASKVIFGPPPYSAQR